MRLPKLKVSDYVEVHELVNEFPHAVNVIYKKTYYKDLDNPDVNEVESYLDSALCSIYRVTDRSLEEFDRFCFEDFLKAFFDDDNDWFPVEEITQDKAFEKINNGVLEISQFKQNPNSFCFIAEDLKDKMGLVLMTYQPTDLIPSGHIFVGVKSTDPTENPYHMFWGPNQFGNRGEYQYGHIMVENVNRSFKVFKIVE